MSQCSFILTGVGYAVSRLGLGVGRVLQIVCFIVA
jgi:hypothetical protein